VSEPRANGFERECEDRCQEREKVLSVLEGELFIRVSSSVGVGFVDVSAWRATCMYEMGWG